MTEDFEIVWRIINGQKTKMTPYLSTAIFFVLQRKSVLRLLCIITWYHGKEKLIYVINYVLLLSKYLGKQCFIVLIKILVIIGNRKWWCFKSILSKKILNDDEWVWLSLRRFRVTCTKVVSDCIIVSNIIVFMIRFHGDWCNSVWGVCWSVH